MNYEYLQFLESEIRHTLKNTTEVSGLLQLAVDTYDYVLLRTSDPRTLNWPLIDSPVPTIIMVLCYLYFVLFIGPKMMENRKPYQVRKTLVVYNAGQVLFSSYMFYEHLMSGWFFHYNYFCEPVNYTYEEKAIRMATLCWWYYISKLTEFADTIFFTLRKKTNQITVLHVYHHSLTPLETWILVRFVPGGHGTFSNLLNNFVHIIMYSYYMMSAMGPQYQQYLWWKKHLTSIQLIQFVLVFVHSGQLLFSSDCGYPKFLASLLLLHSSIFIVLFSNFYIKSYGKVNKEIKEIKQD